MADARIADALVRLPDYFGNHVLVSVTALALGLAVSLPLALLSLAAASLARPAAGRHQHRPNDSRPRAACSVLSASARRRGAVGADARHRLLRAGVPAGGAGAGALQHAAGGPEHHHRHHGRGPRDQAGGDRRRHERAAVAAHGGAAAGAAGDHGRRAHSLGVGDRHRHAVDADRPDQPRQLHFHRPADPELGFRPVRLRCGRAAGPGGRSTARADGARVLRPQPQPCGYRRPRARAHRAGRTRPEPGAKQERLCHRRQAVRGAVHPGGADRGSLARERPQRRPARRARISGHLRRARRRRHRCLRGIFRDDLGQPDAARRRATARRGPGRGRQVAQGATSHRDGGRAWLRERLCAGDGAQTRG